MAASRSKQSHALLLLPSPPPLASYATLKATYSATLATVLKEVASAQQNSQRQALLEIALPLPAVPNQMHAPRAPYYADVQQLVASLYKLICITASREGIDTETNEGIDARILLVAHPAEQILALDETSVTERAKPAVMGVRVLASNGRQWDTVFSVRDHSDSDHSISRVFQQYSKVKHNYKEIQGDAVDTGGVAVVDTSVVSSKDSVAHFSVAVGGTFDHLHIGHKLLLTMFAFVLSQDVSESQPQVLTVGITGDALLVNKKYAEHLQSWKQRQESTHDFLSSLLWYGLPDDTRIETQEFNEPGPNGHAVHVRFPTGLVVRYVEIADPFGPTITDKDITALVLSLETRGGGEAVNNKRKEQGWAPLEVFEVDVLDASEEGNVDETFQSKLSSTEIRRKRSERL